MFKMLTSKETPSSLAIDCSIFEETVDAIKYKFFFETSFANNSV